MLCYIPTKFGNFMYLTIQIINGKSNSACDCAPGWIWISPTPLVKKYHNKDETVMLSPYLLDCLFLPSDWTQLEWSVVSAINIPALQSSQVNNSICHISMSVLWSWDKFHGCKYLQPSMRYYSILIYEVIVRYILHSYIHVSITNATQH